MRDCERFREENALLSTHGFGGAILDLNGKEIVRSHFGSKNPNIVSNHEILRLDLESDGIEEAYITPTIDNEVILEKNRNGDSSYLNGVMGGTLERFDIENVSDHTIVDSFTGGYVKQVFSLRHEEKPYLIALLSNVSSQTTEIRAYFSDGVGNVAHKTLSTVPRRECRTSAVGNFGFPGTNVVIGCEKGLYAYSFDGTAFSLMKEYDFAPFASVGGDPNDKQVHILQTIDVDGDGNEELLAGIDMDGISVYDFRKGKIEKAVDL